jgi:hypothetical protein
VNTDSLVDTVNVLNTSAGVPVQVNAANHDTINVGNAGSVQGILAPVTITNPPNWNTINIDDSADPAARYVQLNTFTSGGESWGNISGLAPAAISYKYNDTFSVNLTTGTGADTVNVQATGVQTSIADHGHDTVNVGNAGSVQGILGNLFLSDPTDLNTINIDDSAGPVAGIVTLSTPAGNSPPWGEVSGLAPAFIMYAYDNTDSVHVAIGPGANQVDVGGTGVPTYITDHGPATVNLSDLGSVQGIQGALFLSGQPSVNTLNIDDAADTAPRTVTLNTFTPTGDTAWGEVAGPAPAPIYSKYADTSSVHHTTNPAGDTINVSATGVPT